MNRNKLNTIVLLISSILIGACSGGGGDPAQNPPGNSPPPPTLNLSPGNVIEGDSGNSSNLVFAVSLSGPASGDVLVDYSTSNASSNNATAGSDYTATNGTLTIPAGATSATITVPVTGDDTIEADEVFTLSLFNLSGNATMGTDQALGTILDDDLPQLSISPVGELEGDAGVRGFVFNVSLDAPATTEVIVDYTTADGSATAADNDYVPESGTVAIPAGNIATIIAVDVNGDTNPEPNESFTVALSNLSGDVVMGTDRAAGTIIDDDTSAVTPSVSVSGRALVEGDTGTDRDITFTVVVDPPSGTPVTVRYTTADDTAVAPDDYTAVSGTVTVPANSAGESINVTVIGDNDDEGSEAFLIALELLSGDGALAAPSARGFIIDNDGVQPLTLSVPGITVFEGDSGTRNAVFDVLLSAPAPDEVTIEYATEDIPNSAVAGSDYTAVSGIVGIDMGELSTQISVPIIGDRVIEADEMFRLNLSNIAGGGAVLGNAQTLAVIRTDDPLAQISVADAGVAEGDNGTVDLLFTVSMSAAAAENVTVDYNTADSTATLADGDYSGSNGTLTIPAGDLSGTITVPVNGDTNPENDEVFLLTLSNPSNNAQIVDDQANGTIVNDDGNAGWQGPELVRQDRTASGQTRVQPLFPHVAFGSTGALLAAWAQNSPTFALYSSESVAPGNWSSPELLGSDSHSTGRGADLLFDDAGNALAVWTSRGEEATANTLTTVSGWDTSAPLAIGEVLPTPRVRLAGIPSTGEAFAVWNESQITAANGFNTVWFSRFIPGTGWQETAPIDPVADHANWPRVAVDGNGVALSVWGQSDPLSNETSIVAYRYDRSSGDWLGPDALDNGAAGAIASNPSIAINNAGNAIAAWTQGPTATRGVWASRYIPGIGWTGAELISETDTLGRLNDRPDVAIDAGGNAFVIWRSRDNAAGRSSYDLWARRFDNSLTVPDWGVETLLEFDNTDDTLSGLVEAQVVADDAGNAIATWSQGDGTRHNVRAARYSIADQDWGPEELIEALDTGDSNAVHLAIDRDSGNAAVVWQTLRPDPVFGSNILASDIWINRFVAP